MSARYIVRLDDACAGMSRERWRRVEQALDDHGIKPIVAVVPDNQDPELAHDDADPAFWDRVRLWQAKGWTIAMHGYRHAMHRTDAKQILPFYARSEFSGLSYDDQAAKIRAARAIFEQESVRPTVWVAPAHCFDRTTLAAIRDNTDIRVISDGLATQVFFDDGFYWVPQQLWSFRKRPFGLWTVCCHPSMMTDAALARFGEALAANAGRITSLDQVALIRRRKGVLDRAANALFWISRRQYRAAFG